MPLRRRQLLAAAALAPAIGACGIGGPSFSGEALVFTVGPLSGGQAESGQTVAGGVRLAAELANRAGGALGRKIVVRALNDEATPAVAKAKALEIQAAARSATVLGVVGHVNSGCTIEGLPIYRDAGLACITPKSSNPTLTQSGFTTFVRICANDATQGPVAAQYLLGQNLRRIAIAHTDNLYARGLRQTFGQAVQSGGGTATAAIELREGATTFAAALPQLTAGSPDAIYFAGDEPEGLILVRELRRAGFRGPIMASDGCFVESFIDELGTASEGLLLSTISPDPKRVADKEWFDRYREIEHRNPGIDSTNGFAALDVLLQGVRRAGRAEGRAVADAIRALDHPSLVGRVQYDQNGDLREQRVFIYRIEKGAFAQVA
jgi:branched-chain amino acid transport system substrate-binding protein